MVMLPAQLRLDGRTIVVTGAGSGIGAATARLLLETGADVLAVDNRLHGSAKVEESPSSGGRLTTLLLDIALPGSVQQLRQVLGGHRWPLRGLVHSAAYFPIHESIPKNSDWDRAFDVNVRAISNLTFGLASLLGSQGGSVVIVGSVSGQVAQKDMTAYGTLKGALPALSRSLALQLVGEGLRVNCVAPGWVWTGESQRNSPEGRAAWEQRASAVSVLGRGSDPVEIAWPIVFLLSDAASFVTGALWSVDGGYSALGPEGSG